MSNYPEEMVAPMRQELTQVGFRQLMSASQVDEALQQPGTTLLLVNSVCGCAAAGARPGVVAALRTMGCLLYTSPSPRDGLLSRMPSSA